MSQNYFLKNQVRKDISRVIKLFNNGQITFDELNFELANTARNYPEYNELLLEAVDDVNC